MPWQLWRRKRQAAPVVDVPPAEAEEAAGPAVEESTAASALSSPAAGLYTRNWAFISPELQERLANTTLLTAGTGLGSVIAVLAARTGVQRFILADGDTVEESNLNRQAFTRAHLGQNKAEATASIIADIQPNAKIEIVPRYLDAADCAALAPRADIILNTIDLDTPAFLELNRAARTAGKPVLFPFNPAWAGTLLVFVPDGLSLDEFLGMQDFTEGQPIGDVALRLVERIYAQMPGGMPNQLKAIVQDYFDPNSEHFQVAPQLGVTTYLTSALAVRALVALVANEPVRTAPHVITADAFAEVAPTPAPIREN